MLELAVTRVQLGFRTFAVFRSFTAVPRNLNLRVLSSLRTQAMGSGRKGKKASASENIDLKSDNDVAEENGVRNKVPGILGIERDPSKLERMTVTELRAALRDVGASTKGPKHQLVSALKTILCNEIDGKHSPAADELSSKIETLPAQESVERANASSEASRRWQKRKSKHVDGEEYVVSDNVVQVEQQVLKESGMTSGKKRITKRKIIAETSKRSVGVSEGIEEPVFESEPWTTFAHKKPQKGWIAYNPRTMRPPPLTRNSKFLKLMSWNVNGLRALLKMEGFSALQLAQREDFDILCLQETKLQEKDVESMRDLLEGYENSFWTCSVSKPGYSGTTIISRIKPLSVKYGLGISDHDTEGRLVTAEFDSFYLLCAYVPNSGDGLKRLSYRISQWDPSLSSYMQELEKSKPVILTGDLNCAHQEIDIYNPAGNRRSAGFTDEERQSFEMNFLSKGYVDTFRKQHPHAVGYTYWGYRHGARKTNRGWRLDYFLVSELIAENVHDSYILPDVTGSDHCPIGLVLKY